MRWISVWIFLAWSGHVSAKCDLLPAIDVIEAIKVYVDKKGSVKDSARAKQNQNLLLPARIFLEELTTRVDSGESAKQRCALAMLKKWSDDKALLGEHDSFPSRRHRLRLVVAINFAAIKLKGSGVNVQEIMPWLDRVNQAVQIDFSRKRNRIDNLQAWSGVAALSHAFLGGSEEARKSGLNIWQAALSVIDGEGFLKAEVGRGMQARNYHAYGLGAILLMREFLRGLGISPDQKSTAAIARLGRQVAFSTCDSSRIAEVSGSSNQEPVADWVVAPVLLLLEPEFVARQSFCLARIPEFADEMSGGRFDLTVSAVRFLLAR